MHTICYSASEYEAFSELLVPDMFLQTIVAKTLSSNEDSDCKIKATIAIADRDFRSILQIRGKKALFGMTTTILIQFSAMSVEGSCGMRLSCNSILLIIFIFLAQRFNCICGDT